MFSRVSFLSVFATFVALSASHQCFGLDGSKLDNTFAPCNPTAKHSGCCATNRPSGAELCLDSGLCMSTIGESTGMIWQAGCTDESGKAVECPRVCPGGMLHHCTQTLLSMLTVSSIQWLRWPDRYKIVEHPTMRLWNLLLSSTQ